MSLSQRGEVGIVFSHIRNSIGWHTKKLKIEGFKKLTRKLKLLRELVNIVQELVNTIKQL